jgi:hypothetical protein
MNMPMESMIGCVRVKKQKKHYAKSAVVYNKNAYSEVGVVVTIDTYSFQKLKDVFGLIVLQIQMLVETTVFVLMIHNRKQK